MFESLIQQLEETGKLHLSIKVRPNAHATTLKEILDDGTLKIDIAAPPEKGKANEALIRYLAEEFFIPKEMIHITSGQTSTRKSVYIEELG